LTFPTTKIVSFSRRKSSPGNFFPPGLPDGIFFKPKIPIKYILDGLRMENVGVFYCHLKFILRILRPLGIYCGHVVGGYLVRFIPILVHCIRKNLATLLPIKIQLGMEGRTPTPSPSPSPSPPISFES
jgi:hypothetical protein